MEQWRQYLCQFLYTYKNSTMVENIAPWYHGAIWVIIKKHALFCYYAIKRQKSTKLIGENMFCMKAHQLSIVLPSKSRLVQLRIHTSYTKTCYFSGMTYFWSFVLFRCYDFIRSLYYFWTIPKTLIAQHYFCLIYIEI